MPTVFITAPAGAAQSIAQTIVKERLAACVNRVACVSTYRWQGEVRADDEEILLAKTTDKRYSDLRDRVAEIHPHDVTCIERFDETDITTSFAEWRAQNVTES